MFGPGVEAAQTTYKQVRDDPELLGVMLLFGSTDRWIEKFRVKGDRAYGYDAKGDEVANVPLKEPIFVRPLLDVERGVYRHNIT
jgi:nitrate reductase beta subunit